MPWQAVFHLQTRVPAILPPICALLDLPEDAVLERPLHGGREAPHGLLEVRQLLVCMDLACWTYSSGCGHSATVGLLYKTGHKAPLPIRDWPLLQDPIKT